MNTETIFTIYIDVVLTHGESIHPCAKYSAFYIMCDFLEKDIKFPNWSCVLNCYSERPGVFFWCRSNWWGWCVYSIHFISSIQKYKLFLLAQTAIAWSRQKISFIHEYRNRRERKSYNTEKYCTEIMQHFGLLFRILNSRN